MINLFHKHKNQKGAATLLIATVMLIAMSLVVTFSASTAMVKEKISSNQFDTNQAYMAAEAGLEYGLLYLQANRDKVIDESSPTFTYTSTALTNVTLADGSRFSITYSNTSANDYSLIKISSVGISMDGETTKTISQLVKSNMPSTAISSKGRVEIKKDSQIINHFNDKGIKAAGDVKIKDNAKVDTKTCESNKSSKCYNVIENDPGLLAITQDNVFQTLFAQSYEQLFSTVDKVYTNISAYDGIADNVIYKNKIKAQDLDGLKGESVMVLLVKKGNKLTEDPFAQPDDGEGEGSTPDAEKLKIDKDVTIGTTDEPVLLIVYGKMEMSKESKINGFVYVFSDEETKLKDGAQIEGGLITAGKLRMDKDSKITYNPNVLANTPLTATFAKVPGTWRDY